MELSQQHLINHCSQRWAQFAACNLRQNFKQGHHFCAIISQVPKRNETFWLLVMEIISVAGNHFFAIGRSCVCSVWDSWKKDPHNVFHEIVLVPAVHFSVESILSFHATTGSQRCNGCTHFDHNRQRNNAMRRFWLSLRGGYAWAKGSG